MVDWGDGVRRDDWSDGAVRCSDCNAGSLECAPAPIGVKPLRRFTARHSGRAQAAMLQAEFIERFNVGLVRLRSWERGRYAPDAVAVAYVKVIRHSPEVAEAAFPLVK